MSPFRHLPFFTLAALLLVALLAGCGAPSSGMDARATDAADELSFRCNATQTICGGSCVDLRADPANCGRCGAACPSGQLCVAGACMVTAQCGLQGGPCCSTGMLPCNPGLVCTSGTCTPQAMLCGALGDTCTAAGGCCNGEACQAQQQGGRSTCCRTVTSTCTRDTECCGQTACVMGRCACQAVGSACASDADCCNGNTCASGMCRDSSMMSVCGLTQGQACTPGTSSSPPNCCVAGLSCDAASAHCCANRDASCTTDAGCCGGLQCVLGRCGDAPRSNIRHVVVIVQENHTFDSYFGRYCGAAAGSNPTCNTGPACCERAPDREPRGASPIALTDASNFANDRNHDRVCEVAQINGGLMNNFVTGSGMTSTLGPNCSDPSNWALAGTGVVDYYRSLASRYAIADRYFQPTAGGTSANDMYFAIAQWQFDDNALSPRAVGYNCFDGRTGVAIHSTPTTFTGRTTIADLLLDNANTFGVYADRYAEAVAAAPSCPGVPSDCPYSTFTHPIAARGCLFDPSDIPFEYYARFQDDPRYVHDYSAFAADIAARRLPDFAFLKAATYRNEHPNISNISDGVSFVRSAIDAVMASPYANDTLILLTWDEGGGFFDHISPPASIERDPMGNAIPYGTRVPMLAIGRFARSNFVSHVQLEHSSIVRFLEWNFLGAARMGALGHRDMQVTSIGSLLDPAQVGLPIPD